MYVKYKAVNREDISSLFTSAGALRYAKLGTWKTLVDTQGIESVTDHFSKITEHGRIYIAKDKDTMLRGFRSVGNLQVDTGDGNLMVCHGSYSEITMNRAKVTLARSIPGFVESRSNKAIRKNAKDLELEGEPQFLSRQEANTHVERMLLRSRGYFVFVASRQLHPGNVPPDVVYTYMGGNLTSYGMLAVLVKRDRDI